MRAPLAVPAVALTLAIVLGGCGDGGRRVPNLNGLPLVGGSRVVMHTKLCDPGANAYCQEELVVTNARFESSAEFLDFERAVLHKLGWTGQYAPNGNEHSDDSPGHKLRVVFATAQADLLQNFLGTIKRPHTVTKALAESLLHRQPTLSILLQAGPS